MLKVREFVSSSDRQGKGKGLWNCPIPPFDDARRASNTQHILSGIVLNA